MFTGHYAVSIAAASQATKKGTLTYLAFASILPDILMFSLGNFIPWNFHADLGLIVAIALVCAVGILAKFDKKTLLLGLLCLGLHVPFDFFYMSHDSSNLYAHPWADFAIEASLILAAGSLYLKKQTMSKTQTRWFVSLCAGLVVIQGIWNFAIKL